MLNHNNTQQLWSFLSTTVAVKKPSILIVDDSDSVWFSMKRIFKGFPGEVLFAQDGAKGVKLYHQHKPMLTFIDLRMPILNGVDFLTQVESGFEKEQVIAVLTGHGDDQQLQQCFTLGASYFISKPFNIHEIRGIARSVIKQIQKLQQQRAEEQELHRKQLTIAYQNGLQEQISHLVHNLNNSIMPAALYLNSFQEQRAKLNAYHSSLRKLVQTENIEPDKIPLNLTDIEALSSEVSHMSSVITEAVESTEKILVMHRNNTYSESETSHDFSLEEAISNVLFLTKSLVKKYNIRFECMLDDTLPNIHLPQNGFQQTLANLLRNAIEGIIERKKREELQGLICIQAQSSSNSRFVIRIADNGCGIPTEHQNRLFQGNFSTKGQWYGYGLSSVLVFLESIGGTITFDSEGLDQGSEFTIELPKKHPSSP